MHYAGCSVIVQRPADEFTLAQRKANDDPQAYSFDRYHVVGALDDGTPMVISADTIFQPDRGLTGASHVVPVSSLVGNGQPWQIVVDETHHDCSCQFDGAPGEVDGPGWGFCHRCGGTARPDYEVVEDVRNLRAHVTALACGGEEEHVATRDLIRSLVQLKVVASLTGPMSKLEMHARVISTAPFALRPDFLRSAAHDLRWHVRDDTLRRETVVTKLLEAIGSCIDQTEAARIIARELNNVPAARK